MIDKGILTAETEGDHFILANISEAQMRKKTHITDSNNSHEAYFMFLAKSKSSYKHMCSLPSVGQVSPSRVS